MEVFAAALRLLPLRGITWAGSLPSFRRLRSSRPQFYSITTAMSRYMVTSQLLRKTNMDQLTFLSEELHANHSASQVSEADWMMTVVTSPLNFVDLLIAKNLVGSSGKTSPVFCQAEEDGTLVPSSGRWLKSGTVSPTGSWTLNTSEWPKDAVVCSLSDTLETGDVPQRFFLSSTACQGILRRAEKRGKKLPDRLRLALEAVAIQDGSDLV